METDRQISHPVPPWLLVPLGFFLGAATSIFGGVPGVVAGALLIGLLTAALPLGELLYRKRCPAWGAALPGAAAGLLTLVVAVAYKENSGTGWNPSLRPQQPFIAAAGFCYGWLLHLADFGRIRNNWSNGRMFVIYLFAAVAAGAVRKLPYLQLPGGWQAFLPLPAGAVPVAYCWFIVTRRDTWTPPIPFRFDRKLLLALLIVLSLLSMPGTALLRYGYDHELANRHPEFLNALSGALETEEITIRLPGGLPEERDNFPCVSPDGRNRILRNGRGQYELRGEDFPQFTTDRDISMLQWIDGGKALLFRHEGKVRRLTPGGVFPGGELRGTDSAFAAPDGTLYTVERGKLLRHTPGNAAAEVEIAARDIPPGDFAVPDDRFLLFFQNFHLPGMRGHYLCILERATGKRHVVRLAGSADFRSPAFLHFTPQPREEIK